MGEGKRRRDHAQHAFDRLPPEQKDQSIEPQYREKMTAIVQALDEMFNGRVGGPGRKTGFVLLVFPFDELDRDTGGQGRSNYMSNGADRKDIVVLMKEMIARFEGQPEATGRA